MVKSFHPLFYVEAFLFKIFIFVGGILLKGNVTGKHVEQNGKLHYRSVDGSAIVDVDTIKLHLDDLFKGNPQLTDNLNKVIEENMDVLAEDVKPIVAKTLAEVFLQFCDTVGKKMPFYTLHPKD